MNDNLSNSTLSKLQNTVPPIFKKQAARDLCLRNKARDLFHPFWYLHPLSFMLQNTPKLAVEAYGHMLLGWVNKNIEHVFFKLKTAHWIFMAIPRVQMAFLLLQKVFRMYHKFSRILILCRCTPSFHKTIDVENCYFYPARNTVKKNGGERKKLRNAQASEIDPLLIPWNFY